MFTALIETGKVPTEELFDKSVIAGHGPVDWLCGQLWNSADLLSSALRAELDHAADTYGQAARLIHAGRRASLESQPSPEAMPGGGGSGVR